MTRLAAWRTAAALLGLGLLGAACGAPEGAPGSTPEPGTEGALPAGNGSMAAIYFPATSGMLEPELRPAPTGLDRSQRNLWLAEQLAAGPETSGLRAALPAGTEVASVYSAPDGIAYVDFTVEGETVGMGSRDEMLAIYSVINTILQDDTSADRLVILINGRQRETFAGHVDTSRPLAARPDLIRKAG